MALATKCSICCLSALLLLTPKSAVAQSSSAQGGSENATQEAPATFNASVNLVVVPVVVRDKQSNAVATFHKEDFQLFDNGKPQVISRFSIETRNQTSKTPQTHAAADSSAPPSQTAISPEAMSPDRFALYVFDDLNLQFGDLSNARTAAKTAIHESLVPQTRVALFTTSGIGQQDFTSDESVIFSALSKLRPRGANNQTGQCPEISLYMADAIVNKRDPQALSAEVMEAETCSPNTNAQMLQQLVQSEARGVLSQGQDESRTALRSLANAVRRLSASPGQRNLVLVSSGFLTPELLSEVSDLIDLAVKNRIVISSLDARGLYVPGAFADASQRIRSSTAQIYKSGYERAEAEARDDILGELADGTGGSFVHDNNDLLAGLRRIAIPPETSYILGFSNQNVKPDGKFHSLKVKLKDGTGYSIQARRGYFAPLHSLSAEEQSKAALEEAVFSRDQTSDFPIRVRNHFFKTSDVDAKLSVVVHVDIRPMRFAKAEDRERDTLTAIAALFDRDGNYVIGQESTLTMSLLEETFRQALSTGVTMNINLNVKPGAYLIRTVVRDSEARLVATANDTIEIP